MANTRVLTAFATRKPHVHVLRVRTQTTLAHALNSSARSSPVPDPAYTLAIESARKNVGPATVRHDPFSVVSHEMSTLAKNIASLVGANHPTLSSVARYYFESPSKHVRPLLVLLISKALAALPVDQRNRRTRDETDATFSEIYGEGSVDDPLSPLAILHEASPDIVLNPLSRPMEPLHPACGEILPKQRRLAEIVEMIHTASLLHDDVIDNSNARRGKPAGNLAFSNKMAILAGDFVLGRASVAISRLRNPEVVELISTSIANLVEGEFMQLKNTAVSSSTRDAYQATFEYYLHKTYLKTASLMSKSCRAAAVIAGAREHVVDACYGFGRNIGLCFQIVDDMLDYTAPEVALGKPSGADLRCGLATAPVLFAWDSYSDLGNMIRRKFDQPGDVQLARDYVARARGVERTRVLATEYYEQAMRHLSVLPASPASDALAHLAHVILTRRS